MSPETLGNSREICQDTQNPSREWNQVPTWYEAAA
jgi:hypothetical protein